MGAMASDRYRQAVEEARQLLDQSPDALEQRRKRLAERDGEMSKQKADASREQLANIVKVIVVPMPRNEDEERSPHFWRGLAELALMEAERTMDPQTQQVLRHIADDYFRLAEQVEARVSSSGRG
jgi:hypothetical protein